MKLTMTIKFDPFQVNPKDIKTALHTAGVSEDDITIGRERAARVEAKSSLKTKIAQA